MPKLIFASNRLLSSVIFLTFGVILNLLKKVITAPEIFSMFSSKKIHEFIRFPRVAGRKFVFTTQGVILEHCLFKWKNWRVGQIGCSFFMLLFMRERLLDLVFSDVVFSDFLISIL